MLHKVILSQGSLLSPCMKVSNFLISIFSLALMTKRSLLLINQDGINLIGLSMARAISLWLVGPTNYLVTINSGYLSWGVINVTVKVVANGMFRILL